MALLFGDLAQASPGAAALTALYTVPAGKRATVKVSVANRGAASTFRLALAIGGAADVVAQYKAWDMAIDAGGAMVTEAMTLGAGDKLRVQGASADLSFTANGIEEDI